MKLDPSTLFLGSLVALVLSAFTIVVALVVGEIQPLMQSPGIYAVVGTSLLVLLVSYHVLGKPLDENEKAALLDPKVLGRSGQLSPQAVATMPAAEQETEAVDHATGVALM